MFLPPGFDKTIALEAADLVLQAYQQYQAFIHGQAWTVTGNYQTLGLLLARPGLLPPIEPFGFVVLNQASGNVFVTFRGTQSALDWLADFSVPQVNHAWGKVEEGFNHIYSQCSGSVLAAVGRAAGKPVFITGHSLGAALAVLATTDLVIAGNAPKPTMYSFAGPRVGDPAFADKFNQLVPAPWRVVNSEDIVTTVPLATLKLAPSDSMKIRMAFALLQDLEYQHVGSSVPFTAHRGSIAGNHDMNLYRATVAAA